MNQIVKRMVLALLPALCSLTAMAQWDLEGVEVDRSKWVDYTPAWNPDPQLMIPGGGSTGYRQQAEAAERAGRGQVQRQRRLQDASTDELPVHWNSTNQSKASHWAMFRMAGFL